MVKMKIVPIAFLILFVAAIIGLLIVNKFFVLLKEKDYKTWEAIGSPSLISNNSIKTNFETWKFLKEKKYLEINDLQLTRISQILWIYYNAYIVCFILVVVLVLREILLK